MICHSKPSQICAQNDIELTDTNINQFKQLKKKSISKERDIIEVNCKLRKSSSKNDFVDDVGLRRLQLLDDLTIRDLDNYDVVHLSKIISSGDLLI